MAQYGFGTGILTGIRTDTSGVNTPIQFGAFQGVAVEFGGDQKELYDVHQYPLDTARGKTKITGKAKVAKIYARMYNELFFAQTLSSGATKYAWNESATLGTGAASYTVANAGSTPLVDEGVFHASDLSQLIPVSSAPGSGQYTFVASTGVYTFSTFEASLGILFNYTYHVATGFTISGSNPLMGTTPRFQAVLSMNTRPVGTNQTVLKLFACTSTRLTFPTSIDDYSISDLDFSAYAADNGQVFEWSTAE